MSHFMEMEWDWENLVEFGSKSNESPKRLQLADWSIVDNDGEANGGGSDGGRHPSSAKSSISASTDSSCKDRMLTFTTSEAEGSSPAALNASVPSAEALLGLKLGKRTYFENNSFSWIPTPDTTTTTTTTTTPKKTKSTSQNAPICCQVEDCNVDLSLAKEYHRKHRVCDSHSKCPKVVVEGRERRFCQQCSRFHSLSEFDEKKRSCRRRLSDHNARRRKPQQETIQFNSPRLCTPFFGGGTQQMSFVLNDFPLGHSRIPANNGWNNSKFMLAKGCSSLKSDEDGGIDEQLHLAGTRVPQAINTHNAVSGFSVSKNTPSLVSNQGSKGSLMISPLDGGPEYHRALSLLSSNSWDSCVPEPEPVQLHRHQLHENNSSNSIQPMIHAIPFSSQEYWSSGPHPTQHHPQSLSAFKSPCNDDFYSNQLN